MELGCFLAGALVSSQGHMVTEEIMAYIEPIRDFLAIIFFASIGIPLNTVIPLTSVWDTSVMAVYKYAYLESEERLTLKVGKWTKRKRSRISWLLVRFHQCDGRYPGQGLLPGFFLV